MKSSTVRSIIWRLVCGGLKAILATYDAPEDEHKYGVMMCRVHEFIQQVDCANII